jgi:2-deoxy-D-gluconate 3-dehydrogenase
MSHKPVALITGASYGVGAQTAIDFSNQGYDVVLTARKLDNLDPIKSTLLSQQVSPLCLTLNLDDQHSIDKVSHAIDQHFHRLDVLVNNAGANVRELAIDVTEDQWDSVFNTNLKGTFFLTQAVAKYMIGKKIQGNIVNVASVHGLQGAVERSTYGISKAGLIQMTKMLAIEWAEHSIRVNAVAPGRLMTDSPSRSKTSNNTEYMKAMLAKIPLHRLATVEEVSAAIVFLASASASSITGQTMVLDGGLTVS